MNIELEKLKKLEHALCEAIDILRDWQVEEVKPKEAKPEGEQWVAYLTRPKNRACFLDACREDDWEIVQQEEYGAKTKLFVGFKNEVCEWYEARQKFAEVIKAWEDGKTIQFRTHVPGNWVDGIVTPAWNLNTEYRVKPECSCEDGIDSKACVGCEHSEDGKRKYKPYVTVDEFIQDFQERFPTAVPRPAYTMPLIWVKYKKIDWRYLITTFTSHDVEIGGLLYKFEQLYNNYTYLDGSPVGMEVEE